MESTRPIRALKRGLDALTILNMRDGATVSEVAQGIRLPRTTVYRILETLCDAGFVFRDEADDRYRLTAQVRTLSHGFVDEAWVGQIAKPLIDELCRDLALPVSITTPSGTTMPASATRALRHAEEHSVSVPVVLGERVLASLTVRFAASAEPVDEALDRLMPKLRRCAGKIGILFSEQQVEARSRSAPQATA
jgi:DNA-binding IclR family transcriptional regulator